MIRYKCIYNIGSRYGIEYRLAYNYEHAIKVFGNITNIKCSIWRIEHD